MNRVANSTNDFKITIYYLHLGSHYYYLILFAKALTGYPSGLNFQTKLTKA